MPTYLYYCEECDKEFEIDQKITDDRLKQHSKTIDKDGVQLDTSCGPVKRLIAGKVAVSWKNGPPTSKSYM